MNKITKEELEKQAEELKRTNPELYVHIQRQEKVSLFTCMKCCQAYTGKLKDMPSPYCSAKCEKHDHENKPVV